MVLPDVTAEQVERMRMAKEQARLLAAQRLGKSPHALVVEADGVEVTCAIDEEIAHAALESLLPVFGVAPHLGDAAPEFPAAPLVGANRAGPLPFHAFTIDGNLQRHARRTRCLLQRCGLWTKRRRAQCGGVGANVGLRENWQRFEVFQATKIGWMPTVCDKQRSIIRNGFVSVNEQPSYRLTLLCAGSSPADSIAVPGAAAGAADAGCRHARPSAVAKHVD